MKVILDTTEVGDKKIGEEADLPEDQARELVKMGAAHAAPEPAQEPQEAEKPADLPIPQPPVPAVATPAPEPAPAPPAAESTAEPEAEAPAEDAPPAADETPNEGTPAEGGAPLVWVCGWCEKECTGEGKVHEGVGVVCEDCSKELDGLETDPAGGE